MPNDWTVLARIHGRKAVMSLTIDDKELDRETERQMPILRDMIKQCLNGTERTALDFGCGSGRFSHMLAQCINGHVTAFDPCEELIALGVEHDDVAYFTSHADVFFDEDQSCGMKYDVVFAAQVLGAPALNLEATAADLVSVMAPNGLLIVIDHMPEIIPSGRWWHFRPLGLYAELFRRNGVEMSFVGTMMQLENEITMIAGRKS